MTPALRPCRDDHDYWRIRDFLREVFRDNGRSEHSWPVPRLDYWRWHLVTNCRYRESVHDSAFIRETADGRIVAVITAVGGSEVRLHVHPGHRSADLEDELLAFAEQRLSLRGDDGVRRVHLPVDAGDDLRAQILSRRGFEEGPGTSHKWLRDLDAAIPAAAVAPGYVIRSMGDPEEHPARSWASWRAFHGEEPDGNYDGDWSWYRNIQCAPLYRRDLDIVAATPDGPIAAFSTIYYDDSTRSAVCVLVGTAAEHQRRGLGRAVMLEGFRRLREMGATRVFATAYDPPADGLYGSVMESCVVARTWRKVWPCGPRAADQVMGPT